MDCNQDFVSISANGISVLDLSPTTNRKLKSNLGEGLMLHSLEAFNYLCIDPNNVILFDLTNEESQITVQHQYTKHNKFEGDQTMFDSIYKVRVFDITLRELLLLQSIQLSMTQSDILGLVKE